MSRDIETRPIRLIVRSIPIVLATFLAACSANASEPKVCYSKFSPLKKLEFKHGFTEQMIRLHDALGDAYNDDPHVVAIPIAKGGSLYLASTCEYATSLQQNLDESILFVEISQEEYEHQVDLASQSGRILRLERN
jgi:hypothetical protein